MKKSFGIIGYGKLGKALAAKLPTIGRLEWVSSAGACDEVPQALHCYNKIAKLETVPDVIFITKADTFIKATAEELSVHFGHRLQDKIIIHCSGIFTKDIINSCEKFGAITVAAHPYQTFYHIQENLFDNVHWAVDCSGNFDEIEEIIKSLNGVATNITGLDGFNNALYHASAVIASNYMNTLIAIAGETAQASGINPVDFLPAILRTTLENNIMAQGNSNQKIPLTGPIVRGDILTIEKHIEALQGNKLLLESYCRLGIVTAELAHSKGLIEDNTFQRINKILTSNIN